MKFRGCARTKRGCRGARSLQQLNSTFKSKVSNSLLSSLTRQYAIGLTHTSERLPAQVTVLQNANKAKEKILNARKERQTGKRGAIKGHFMLSTTELRDKVLEAEAETARKKARKRQCARPTRWPPRRPTKRSRVATPSKESEELSEEPSDGESYVSDCHFYGAGGLY